MKLRHISTAVVVFFSAVAGVLVGDLLINRPDAQPVASYTSTPSYRSSLVAEGMELTLNTGDLFPYEDCIDAAGRPTNFEKIIPGQRRLIVFAAPGCTRCGELLALLQNSAAENSSTPLSIIAAVNAVDREAWIAEKKLSGIDATTVYYDEPTFRNKYNLRVIPTVVTTDRHGFVLGKQIGYYDGLDPEIIHFLRDKSD